MRRDGREDERSERKTMSERDNALLLLLLRPCRTNKCVEEEDYRDKKLLLHHKALQKFISFSFVFHSLSEIYNPTCIFLLIPCSMLYGWTHARAFSFHSWLVATFYHLLFRLRSPPLRPFRLLAYICSRTHLQHPCLLFQRHIHSRPTKMFKIEFQFSSTNLSDFIQMAAISIWFLCGKPAAAVYVCVRAKAIGFSVAK